MFMYEKKLQYPVKIDKPNPRLAAIIISQYGGPDGELGASLRYLSQRYSMPFDERKAAGCRLKKHPLAVRQRVLGRKSGFGFLFRPLRQPMAEAAGGRGVWQQLNIDEPGDDDADDGLNGPHNGI